MIVNLYRYRAYILKNAWISLRHRYAGASAGILWNIAQPLAMLLLYFTVFSTIFAPRIAGGAEEGGSFALYLCAGYLPWVAMMECVTFGTGAFISNAAFLKRLPIPEQVFVAKEAVVATHTLGLSFLLLIGISTIWGHYPGLNWLMLPLPLILFQIFAFGLGLLLGTLNVFFKDVERALSVTSQGWFWLTPIVYPMAILPDFMQGAMIFNPAYPYILATRDIFLYNRPPDGATWLLMLFWSVATPTVAFLVLKKLRPEIRDCL